MAEEFFNTIDPMQTLSRLPKEVRMADANSSDEFVQNNQQMLAAARGCIEFGQVVPALVLMYSQIDALAWSCAQDTQRGKVKANFVQWVAAWLLPHLRNQVPHLEGIDLYAARCGVLHTLTGTSDLTVSGRAKSIGYAHGSADAAALYEQMVRQHPDVAARFVMLKLETFLAALEAAFADLQSAAANNEEFRARLLRARSSQFVRFAAK